MQGPRNDKTTLDRELSARASRTFAKTSGSPGRGVRAVLKNGRKNTQDGFREAGQKIFSGECRRATSSDKLLAAP